MSWVFMMSEMSCTQDKCIGLFIQPHYEKGSTEIILGCFKVSSVVQGTEKGKAWFSDTLLSKGFDISLETTEESSRWDLLYSVHL